MIKILKIIRIFHDHVVKKDRYLQYLCKIICNRPPDRTWRRPLGRPRNKWLDQLRNDSIRPTGDLWRRAVDRGHGGATTRRALAGYVTMFVMNLCAFSTFSGLQLPT